MESAVGTLDVARVKADFPLLARRVKPWPGIVDVEPLPGEGEGDESGD